VTESLDHCLYHWMIDHGIVTPSECIKLETTQNINAYM